ncbi:unnamed protein product, partial [Brassica oleracea var. botrytis]
ANVSRILLSWISLGLSVSKDKISTIPFLSSDEVFTSRYGLTSINYPKPKPTRTKPRRQKES